MFSRNSHLDDNIVDYVDGLMSPAEQLRVEQHLVACQMCRASVEQERALIAKLQAVRVDAGRHQQLMAGLLQMAAQEAEHGRSSTTVSRPAPAVLATGAPAQYHSARRSVGVAIAAAAGCLGVAMVAVHAPGTSGPTPAQVRFTGSSQPPVSTVLNPDTPIASMTTAPAVEPVRMTRAAQSVWP